MTLPTQSHLLLTAACDEVVSATKAYHLALERNAGPATLALAEARQADALHYMNVLTRKLNEASK